MSETQQNSNIASKRTLSQTQSLYQLCPGSPGSIAGESVLRKTYKGLRRPRDVATAPRQARVVGAHAEQRETELCALRRGFFWHGFTERA